ncbi:DNA mismatch repair protein MutS [Peptococcaceae bacterium 1198_IL3148]
MKTNAEEIYQQKKSGYQTELADAKKKDSQLVFYRSALAVTVIGLLVYSYFKEVANLYLYVALLVLIFMVVVNRHRKVRGQISHLENYVAINDQALKRLSGQWTSFPHRGEQFMAAEHPYSGDLNIFGQGSLFQYLNTTNLVTGERALAQLLGRPVAPDATTARQQAIKELASHLDWRQQLQANGIGGSNQPDNLDKLLAWTRERPLFENRNYVYLLWLLPVTTVILFILVVMGKVSSNLPLVTLIMQVVVATLSMGVTGRAFGSTEDTAAELDRLLKLLNHIEGQQFQAPLLVKLQRQLIKRQQTASQQAQALAKIATLINLRYSVVYHFINALIFFDLYTIRALDQWKAQYGRHLERWFEVIGQFEALSSLAILAHDNPQWVFPEVTGDTPYFKATELGHPLINQGARVYNDVSLAQPGTIHIITGSNMSGKSTLLRTVGINLVLAYAGAPVCASALSCSNMNIYTSMRIQDDMEQNTSYFYAEIKRIKLIIDAAHRGESIIFLLDEIFKGTNSRDRITGARIIIKKLAQQAAIGMVTTHDLELSLLADELPRQISNYHFTDQIVGNEITFDYRLKTGVSRTTNAIALMKMIGIDVSDADK